MSLGFIIFWSLARRIAVNFIFVAIPAKWRKIDMRSIRVLIFSILTFLLYPALAFCSSGEGIDPVIPVLFALIIVIIAAKFGGHLASTLKQPEVLGELVVGLVLGNLALVGIHYFDFLKDDKVIEVLSELGVILLLFEVGLETKIQEMSKVGVSAFCVALLGVIAPFILGYYVAAYFVPDESFLAHVFAGATLTATSVGITVRVLKDLKVLDRAESKIVLGAAVIDDVMGLVVLAVVAGLIQAHNSGTSLDAMAVVKIFALAVGFLVVAVLLGRFLVPFIFGIARRINAHGALLATSLLLCFCFSYAAYLVGLAPIVGAFAAGLIIDEDHYQELLGRTRYSSINDLVNPITALLVPIFFISMGARVDVMVFADASILGFAFWLTVAAILGKQVCGLGVLNKGVDRLSVGLGMIPRGEVGLIFIGIGSKLLIDGVQVVDKATFGSVVIMVVITTMITPSLLKWRFGALQKRGI